MTTMHEGMSLEVALQKLEGAKHKFIFSERFAVDVVKAHLAKGAHVPDERVYAPLPSDADEYDRGHVDGWNACREAMLSQRGEVEGG